MGTWKIVTVLLTAVLTISVMGIAVWSIHRTIADLSDPCVTWASVPPGNSGQFTVSIPPNDPCRSRSGHGETRQHAVIVAAFVPGGLLLAATLAIGGALLSRRRVMIAGAIGMLAETIVVGTLAPLTLVAGLGVLYLARRAQRGPVAPSPLT